MHISTSAIVKPCIAIDRRFVRDWDEQFENQLLREEISIWYWMICIDMLWYAVFRLIFGFVWKLCWIYIVIADSKEESERQSSKSNKPTNSFSQNVDEIRDWFAVYPRLIRDCIGMSRPWLMPCLYIVIYTLCFDNSLCKFCAYYINIYNYIYIYRVSDTTESSRDWHRWDRGWSAVDWRLKLSQIPMYFDQHLDTSSKFIILLIYACCAHPSKVDGVAWANFVQVLTAWSLSLGACWGKPTN